VETIRKTIQSEIKDISDTGVITVLATDETLDRDKDIILASGADFKNFESNGAILYAHDYRAFPIGRPLKTYVQNKATYIDIKLADKGTSDFTDAVISLINQKILKGVSIGFSGIEWLNNEFGGRTFTKWELLEVSLVPVPANPSAHVESIKSFSPIIQKQLLGVKTLELEYTRLLTESEIADFKKTFEGILNNPPNEIQDVESEQELWDNFKSQIENLRKLWSVK
jgi:HK97 family phage prohead protease